MAEELRGDAPASVELCEVCELLLLPNHLDHAGRHGALHPRHSHLPPVLVLLVADRLPNQPHSTVSEIAISDPEASREIPAILGAGEREGARTMSCPLEAAMAP